MMGKLQLSFAWIAVAVSVCGGPVADKAALWREREDMWKTPVVHPIAEMNKPGVQAMAVEGEDYQGRATRFFAYWGLPEGASPTNRVPGIVLVHGGAGTAFDSWVRLWTARGYAAIAMDTCGGIPPMVKALGGALRHSYSGPRGYGSANVVHANDPLTDQWTFHAVSTVIRSHSFLRSRPEVDSSCIGITGISWGGYLTACTIGIDDRFAFAAPIYGSAYLYDHSVWSDEMRKQGELGRRWNELWDASNFLPQAKLPVLWATGSNDHFFPLDSLQRGYDLLPQAPRLALRVRMVHAYAPHGDPKEITEFANHFAFGAPALPEVEAKLETDCLVATWRSFGRRLTGAELVYTKSADENWEARYYETLAVPVAADGVSCAIPEGTVICWINLIFENGVIASSRHFALAPNGR